MRKYQKLNLETLEVRLRAGIYLSRTAALRAIGKIHFSEHAPSRAALLSQARYTVDRYFESAASQEPHRPACEPPTEHEAPPRLTCTNQEYLAFLREALKATENCRRTAEVWPECRPELAKLASLLFDLVRDAPHARFIAERVRQRAG